MRLNSEIRHKLSGFATIGFKNGISPTLDQKHLRSPKLTIFRGKP
jgi:hypothetical protein